MSPLKASSVISALVVLFAALFFLAVFVFTGAGHGTGFFLSVLIAPLSAFGQSYWMLFVSASLWLGVVLLLPFMRVSAVRTALITFLLLHYLGVVILCWRTDEWYYIGRVWSTLSWMVLFFAAGYLAIHSILWFEIARRRHRA